MAKYSSNDYNQDKENYPPPPCRVAHYTCPICNLSVQVGDEHSLDDCRDCLSNACLAIQYQSGQLAERKKELAGRIKMWQAASGNKVWDRGGR